MGGEEDRGRKSGLIALRHMGRGGLSSSFNKLSALKYFQVEHLLEQLLLVCNQIRQFVCNVLRFIKNSSNLFHSLNILLYFHLQPG